MRLLEISAADFRRRNVCSDGEHGCSAAMRVIKPVNEVQVAWPAGARAHREPSSYLRLASGGEGRSLLMPRMDPPDRLLRAERLGEAVEAVADDAVDALHAGSRKGLDEIVRAIASRHSCLLEPGE